MAGFPHRYLNSYIARLIARGHKVAVVEQLEDARKVKRLVRRDVVRVVTPGTVMEDALLQDRAENFLVAIAAEPALRQSAPTPPSRSATRCSSTSVVGFINRV